LGSGRLNATGLHESDELAESSVQLVDEKVVETKARFIQPVEGLERHQRDPAIEQRDHFIRSKLAL